MFFTLRPATAEPPKETDAQRSGAISIPGAVKTRTNSQSRAPDHHTIPRAPTTTAPDATSPEVRLISALVCSLYAKNINAADVLCTAAAFCLTRDCPSWNVKVVTGEVPRKPNVARLGHILVIQTDSKSKIYVDFEWRERYRLRRYTPDFQRWFTAVSPVIVAPESSLYNQIKHNSFYVQSCFITLHMEIPPWRRPEALILAYKTASSAAIDVRPLCCFLIETLKPNDIPFVCESPSPVDPQEAGAANGLALSPKLIKKDKSNNLDSYSEMNQLMDKDKDMIPSSYGAPPLLTALTEINEGAGTTYMCVEYSTQTSQSEPIAPSVESKDNGILKDQLMVDTTPPGGETSHSKESGSPGPLAELVSKPQWNAVQETHVDLNLVAQMEGGKHYVIHKVPPYRPVPKGELSPQNKRNEAINTNHNPAMPAPQPKTNPVVKRHPIPRLKVSSAITNKTDMDPSKLCNGPLLWGHVDDHPIYGPQVSKELKELLITHPPSSYGLTAHHSWSSLHLPTSEPEIHTPTWEFAKVSPAQVEDGPSLLTKQLAREPRTVLVRNG